MDENRVKVEYEGSIIYTIVNKDYLYLCPLCNALFKNPRDLMMHIIAHARGYLQKRAKIEKGEASE